MENKKSQEMTPEQRRLQEMTERMDKWEKEHNKLLNKCTESEWIEAMQEIMCISQSEAEALLRRVQNM